MVSVAEFKMLEEFCTQNYGVCVCELDRENEILERIDVNDQRMLLSKNIIFPSYGR